MTCIKYCLFLCILFTNLCSAYSQVSPVCLSKQDFTIVILGSSTAAGSGPSSSDSAWVNRYRANLQSINPNNQVINLAQGGYTTYKSMPTAFVPPPGRPTPDNTKNIDAALAYNPDAVIINYPSNDAANGFGVAEQMTNFDSIVNYAASFGVPVWVCTTQPKTGFGASGDSIQIGVRDSIFSYYGSQAIDFWTTIADINNDINPLYDADGTHLNDAGHAILVDRVINAQIPSALYIAPNSPDYFIYEIIALSDLKCGTASEELMILVANAGNNDGIGYSVSSNITNLSTGSDSTYSFNFSNGLNTCNLDTIVFNADFSSTGYYQITTIVDHMNDTISENDTLQLYIQVQEQPSVLVTNDTICIGNSALLSASSLNSDTIFWYSDPAGTNLIGGGNNFVIPTLFNDTSLYVQAVLGPLVYLDSVNTNQTSNINWNGVMFDVIGLDNIVIDSLSCRVNTLGSQVVEMYYCNGTHLGKETTPLSWTLLHTETINVSNAGEIVHIHPTSYALSMNDTIGIYIMMQNPGGQVSYTSSGSTQSYYGDQVEVYAGSGSSHNFGGSYFPRIWNGTLYSHSGFNPKGQCSSDVMSVSASISIPSMNLGSDTIITLLDSLNLSAFGYSSYSWSNGDITDNIIFDAQVYGVGTHEIYLTAINAYGCQETDTVQVTVLDPTTIDEMGELDFTIYPNPSNGTIYLKASKQVEIEIFDLAGKLIHKIVLFDEQTVIDGSNWDTGVYLIKANWKTNSMTKRLVLIK